jgi:hypothetical protein
LLPLLDDRLINRLRHHRQPPPPKSKKAIIGILQYKIKSTPTHITEKADAQPSITEKKPGILEDTGFLEFPEN